MRKGISLWPALILQLRDRQHYVYTGVYSARDLGFDADLNPTIAFLHKINTPFPVPFYTQRQEDLSPL